MTKKAPSQLEFAEEVIKSLQQLIDAQREIIAAGEHEHHWEVIDIQLPQTAFHPRLQGYTTTVLLRCDICNLPQTTELNGKWSDDQVRGIIDGNTTADSSTSPTEAAE